MESIETLFQNQIKSAIAQLVYHLEAASSLNPQANAYRKYRLALLKDPKGKITPQGELIIYGQFDTYGISRIYRSANKTYPAELAKVKNFFHGKDLSRLVIVNLPFRVFLESCLLSANAQYKDSVVMHPIFMDRMEEILNDKKLILSAGKFSGKAFIWYNDAGTRAGVAAAVDEIVKEVLNQDISLDIFIKIMEDINKEYKNFDYQFRLLSQKMLTELNYAQHSVTQHKAKIVEQQNKIVQQNLTIQDLKNKSTNNNQVVQRPETKITTSRALTWS